MSRWTTLVVGLIALLGSVEVMTLHSLASARRQSAELAASDQALSATVYRMRNQLGLITRRLTELETQHSTPVSQEVFRGTAALVSSCVPRRAPQTPQLRLHQLQSQVDQQRRDIAGAKDQILQARAQFEDSLDSTASALTGSIARTHEELMLLEKRDERTYYEFEVAKSKQFQKVGPVSLSLRKVNAKQKSYDVVVLVDDFVIHKKDISLFEPVWFILGGGLQPLELVVNQLHKDEVTGYLSEAKYKTSELAANPKATPAALLDRGLQK